MAAPAEVARLLGPLLAAHAGAPSRDALLALGDAAAAFRERMSAQAQAILSQPGGKDYAVGRRMPSWPLRGACCSRTATCASSAGTGTG